jgi:hypothetical protein
MAAASYRCMRPMVRASPRATEPVGLFETGDPDQVCYLLTLDSGAGLVDPYLGSQGWGNSSHYAPVERYGVPVTSVIELLVYVSHHAPYPVRMCWNALGLQPCLRRSRHAFSAIA